MRAKRHREVNTIKIVICNIDRCENTDCSSRSSSKQACVAACDRSLDLELDIVRFQSSRSSDCHMQQHRPAWSRAVEWYLNTFAQHSLLNCRGLLCECAGQVNQLVRKFHLYEHSETRQVAHELDLVFQR